MAMVKVFCPYCGKQNEFSLDMHGGLVWCAFCKADFMWDTSHDIKEKCNADMHHGTNTSCKTDRKGAKGYRIIAGAIVLVGMFAAILFYNGTRYQLKTIDKRIYRLDSHSGKMFQIQGRKLSEVEEPHQLYDLSDSEIELIDGRAGFYTELRVRKFGGIFYNGNENVAVKDVVVWVAVTNQFGEAKKRKYNVCPDYGSSMMPLSSENLSARVSIDPEYEFSSWGIITARGYKIH